MNCLPETDLGNALPKNATRYSSLERAVSVRSRRGACTYPKSRSTVAMLA